MAKDKAPKATQTLFGSFLAEQAASGGRHALIWWRPRI